MKKASPCVTPRRESVQNVGTCVQLPTVRQRWDNPIYMPCDHFITRNGSSYLGAHSHHCSAKSLYVFVRGDLAIAFRCFIHKDEPL